MDVLMCILNVSSKKGKKKVGKEKRKEEGRKK